MTNDIKDRRPGYVRQAEEPTVTTCECGARVTDRFGELHHSGPCTKETTMTPYLATGIAEGFEEAESEEQVVEAWQYLHDTGLAYQLQGWFGRTAQQLINDGVINE